MENGRNYHQLVFKMAEASQPDQKSWMRFLETLDTAILGTLSTSVGVIVLIVGISGIVGIQRVGWYDLVVGNPALGVAVIAGEMLGVAGLTIGRVRNGVISPLATLGTAICLIQMYLFFGHFVWAHLHG
jgi:hypothetical protein